MRGVLRYNEDKVAQGQAACIQGHLFMKDAPQLSFEEKLQRFADLMAHNRRVKTNTVHISLNFDVSEHPKDDLLRQIAAVYMEKIGFGQQPYLVYRHDDAAHAHVHIVTTNVQEDGQRISLHNLGRNQSEQARKEIEEQFGLVKAQGRKQAEPLWVQPSEVEKQGYGTTETRRYISKVVRMVTQHYRYGSLPELNAALGCLGVMAWRGEPGTVMHDRKGLVYSMVGAEGSRVGVPVKASALYGKPTLTFLEQQFALHQTLRKPYREPLRLKVEKVLRAGRVRTAEQFAQALDRQGVAVVFRTNAEGRTYGVTFVDQQQQVVFNGSALGKAYGAKGIMERLGQEGMQRNVARRDTGKVQEGKQPAVIEVPPGDHRQRSAQVASSFQMPLETILGLKKKRKRKRKGRRQ